MTRLHDLYELQGQSPWIDNLSRQSVQEGGLAHLVSRGVRGATSNPTIFMHAMTGKGSKAYDEQFESLISSGSVEDAFWKMAVDDVRGALGVFRPVYDESGGKDGFVSIEVAPSLANDTQGTTAAARDFHERINLPNLMVKIPATEAGIPSIHQMTSEGRNINITLIFSIPRYAEVIEAYISGLERFDAAGGDVSQVHSVASFFVSRVDTEVDRRLGHLGVDTHGLAGKTAVAQAKLAYRLFNEQFSGPRWEALAKKGAHRQRPLWASTSTKNPDYPDLLYVDNLIGPDTVNTLPDATIEAFADHGTVARTVDVGVEEAAADLERLHAVGIDLDDVSRVLEEEGVASFSKSFEELMQSLNDKANAGAAGKSKS
ncbi:MAG: transaldolase [Acidimicrobiaceae bacterium]|nr:transaldolase [Acidimicrobiaceae bacterium]MBO0747914.1 transaldolase [Acidimicrobiaceae bacterium]